MAKFVRKILQGGSRKTEPLCNVYVPFVLVYGSISSLWLSSLLHYTELFSLGFLAKFLTIWVWCVITTVQWSSFYRPIAYVKSTSGIILAPANIFFWNLGGYDYCYLLETFVPRTPCIDFLQFKLVLVFRFVENRRLSWPDHTVGNNVVHTVLLDSVGEVDAFTWSAPASNDWGDSGWN